MAASNSGWIRNENWPFRVHIIYTHNRFAVMPRLIFFAFCEFVSKNRRPKIELFFGVETRESNSLRYYGRDFLFWPCRQHLFDFIHFVYIYLERSPSSVTTKLSSWQMKFFVLYLRLIFITRTPKPNCLWLYRIAVWFYIEPKMAQLFSFTFLEGRRYSQRGGADYTYMQMNLNAKSINWSSQGSR